MHCSYLYELESRAREPRLRVAGHLVAAGTVARSTAYKQVDQAPLAPLQTRSGSARFLPTQGSLPSVARRPLGDKKPSLHRDNH